MLFNSRKLWMRAAVFAAAFCGMIGIKARAQSPYIVGADVSYLAEAESQGTVFKDAGVSRPALEILKDHGYNWVRLRLFVNPDEKHQSGEKSHVIALAQRAKKLGFKILLDIHYSDTFADPHQQKIPLQWEGQNHEQLVQSVFNYTRDTMVAFRDAGVLPDMVAIGNEISNGMLWPDGHLNGEEGWQNFTDLLKAAINGIDAGHGNTPRPLIQIHVDHGGSWTETKRFFDKMAAYDVRYDIIGQSFHPWWQGSLDDARDNLYHSAETYHKPIMMTEISYPWKPFSAYGHPGKQSQIDEDNSAAYPHTPEGQADWLREFNRVIESTPHNLGMGLMWWEPAVPAGRPLRGRGLFGDDGNALPAMYVFDAFRRK